MRRSSAQTSAHPTARPLPITSSVPAATARAAAHPVTRFRWIAATIIVAFVLALPESRRSRSTIYDLELVAFGLAHYCLSLHYARSQVRQLFSRSAVWLPIAAVALFCASFVVFGTLSGSMSNALLVYFGIHHVLNEVHMSMLAAGASERAEVRLRVSATVFHTFLYAALVVNDRPWIAAAKAPILAGLLVGSGVYAHALLRTARGERSARELLHVHGIELAAIGLALAVSAFDLRVRWTDIVLFHFLYWLMYPTAKLKALGPSVTRRYVVENVVLVIGFGVMLAFLDRWVILALFNIGSFFHIASSFALSRAQPVWITRWFWPAPTGGPLVSRS
jgi:hypothetical protein